MDKETEINRANRAKAILEDPIFVEANEHIEAELWRQFKALAPSDVEGLAQIKAMQYIHVKYAAFLQSVLTSGKMAQLDLDRARPRPKGY